MKKLTAAFPSQFLIAIAVAMFFLAINTTVDSAEEVIAPSLEEMSFAELQHQFVEAKEAYDANDIGKSISLYETILNHGFVSTELLFNLGNAYFRTGNMGQAILHYRRAWHLSPRDPDIAANMKFALQQAGAPSPILPRTQRLFLHLSHDQWNALLLGTYWLAGLFLCAHIALRFRTSFFLKAAMVMGALAIFAAMGHFQWQELSTHSEWVVLEDGKKALFAPIDESTEHFSLPEGSIVRVAESSEGWLKVQLSDKEGWIRNTACQRVYPWPNEG